MTGGRIYSHALKAVFPCFEDQAPLERKITHERIALLSPRAQTALDFTDASLSVEGKDSYSVLRAPFDQWLASKSEEAGAEVAGEAAGLCMSPSRQGNSLVRRQRRRSLSRALLDCALAVW